MKYLKVFENFQINEALNKDIKSFGSDLGKYLKNGGFDVKYLNGNITDEQRKVIKESDNLVALEIYQNNEAQTLNMYFNPKKLKNIEAIVSKFTLSNYDGPVLTKGWTSKQVKGALNPGDIFKDTTNLNQGLYSFYRLAKVDTKVKTV